MNRTIHALLTSALLVVSVSCSLDETDTLNGLEPDVFYATIEQPADKSTKAYVDQSLKVLWDAGDRISIFNLKDANDEYCFTGQTGDDGGTFELVKDFSEEGVSIDKVYAVYPYSRETSIDRSGTITLELPSEQHYREHSFGVGANLMVSVSKDKSLQFKNACGYLRISLYGEGVSISSIALEGNNNERLAGKATVTMPLDGVPSITMADESAGVIILNCDTPVALGASEEKSTDFWFVVPPVTFSSGFTITATLSDGGTVRKSTSKAISIERNRLTKMAPIENRNPRNVIYYTSSDGEVIHPITTSGFGASIVSNEYVDGVGTMTFDGAVTGVGDYAFRNCKSLTSITFPESVVRIGELAFMDCTGLTGPLTLPESLTSLGAAAFARCTGLTGDLTLPGGVAVISDESFYGCSNLNGSLTLPAGIQCIEAWAFADTPFSKITVLAETAPVCGHNAFGGEGCLIYVPEGAATSYQEADGWKPYCLRITEEGFLPKDFFYCSTDFSRDGEVVCLQEATEGIGIDLIFLGDGFLDKEMGPGGRYETEMMRWADQFFEFEPYTTFRNWFNVYAVKVVSKNNVYRCPDSERRLTKDLPEGTDNMGRSISVLSDLCMEYVDLVPNPTGRRQWTALVLSSDKSEGVSSCGMASSGGCFAVVLGGIKADAYVLNHELGGHGFGWLGDEYGTYYGSPQDPQEEVEWYTSWGAWPNIDWRNDPETVQWARFIRDSRYEYENLGVYEGAGVYAYGLYRPTMNSLMRDDYSAHSFFNAPSREAIYKRIMDWGLGTKDWEYDYETFVAIDEAGRTQAEAHLAAQASSRQTSGILKEHRTPGLPPFLLDRSVREIRVSSNGRITLIH